MRLTYLHISGCEMLHCVFDSGLDVLGVGAASDLMCVKSTSSPLVRETFVHVFDFGQDVFGAGVSSDFACIACIACTSNVSGRETLHAILTPPPRGLDAFVADVSSDSAFA